MRMLHELRLLLWVVLATSLAPGAWNGEAFAQSTIETNVIAAALALPVDLDEMRETHHVITNAGFDRTVRVQVISADWQRTPSFKCHLEMNASLYLRFYRLLGSTWLDFDCLYEDDELAYPSPQLVDVEQGIVFYSIEEFREGFFIDDVGWYTLSDEWIFGDATILDFDQGTAYSFGAIAFESGDDDNDHDYVFEFDGEEYDQWPARLTTNFFTPAMGPFGLRDIDAELILFTLDGTLGSPPRARVDLRAYNKDGVLFAGQSHSFLGFSIVAIDDIDPRIRLDRGFGSTVGHLVLTPRSVSQPTIGHDVNHGNGNGIRRTPVHGWLVQELERGATIGSSPYAAFDPAWGRPLAYSESTLVPDNESFLRIEDEPALDAGCDYAPCW